VSKFGNRLKIAWPCDSRVGDGCKNEQADKTPLLPRSTVFSPWLFFVLVFCRSWVFWILAAASRTSIKTTLGRMLMILGLLGPMLGGIGFTYLARDEEDWREYWSRIVDLKRIRVKWYLVIFLFVPILMAIEVLLDAASDGNQALVQIGKRVTPFISAPSTILPFTLGIFFNGPLPEELGWRGYVLDRLQARWNALLSSVILGAVWALWHLPLFFIKDTYHLILILRLGPLVMLRFGPPLFAALFSFPCER